MIGRIFAVGLLLASAAAAKPACAADSFAIGIMNDQSGPYADLAGPGSVEMARMAIEDFGGSVLGKPIELLVADHQNKVDVGLAMARQWYDERGVRAIFDITNSGVALAIQDLAKARDRIVIFDSASSSDLTGKACSPNGIQWNADNWSNGVALMRLLIKQKLDSFFFITADYAFGASLEADARDAIAKAGGTIVGAVRSPLNTADSGYYLIAAQGSGAKVVVFAITGADLSNALKQANEFKLSPGQYLATPITYLSDVNALGLDVAHDLTFMQSWYWDLDDETRNSPSASTPAAAACRTTTRSPSILRFAITSRRSSRPEPATPTR
jgi:branched-chain amino acid transport system substrate-binding protein